MFSAFALKYGLNEQQALKLASPFGGGIARSGHVCGAVTGALLAIGLQHGAAAPGCKEETYKVASEFLRQFKTRRRTILCRELIGLDISTPAGMQRAREQGIVAAICPALVKDAVEIAASLME